MNLISTRLTKEAHEKAQVIVYTAIMQKLSYNVACPASELKSIREKANEKVKRNNEYNAQALSDLGIEFNFIYKGLQTSTNDPSWYGDIWEVTGKGDFKMEFRQGVGHRECFWSAPWANKITAFVLPPSAFDILYCVMSDNPRNMSFEYWCSDYGYDTDSRNAERIYRACIDQTMMFNRNYQNIDLDNYEPLQNF